VHVEGMDHVGVVVRDIGAAIERYGALLGLVLDGRESFGGGRIEIAFLAPRPGVRPSVELLAPTRPGSTAWDFLRARGEGIEHVAFRVANTDQALEHVRRTAPDALRDTCARPGAGGMDIAFLRPDALFGVLCEFVSARREEG
jgi:methylmalonyl-CoA/ethylmalonyl-CoA epimerase